MLDAHPHSSIYEPRPEKQKPAVLQRFSVFGLRPATRRNPFGSRLALTLGVLALALTALALWGGRAAPAPAYTPRGPGAVYLALGDSLPWGASLSQPQTESFPALLQQRMGATVPIDLVNLAVPGETSASFVRGQLPRAVALLERERRAGRRVSPITLTIGGNDLRNAERGDQEQRRAAVAATQRNLGRIFAELRRAAGHDADIAVMTYYNPYGGDPDDVASEAYWVAQLNAAIRVEAAPHGIVVADIYAPFSGGRAYSYTYILVGDLHATAQGHAVIAEQFWQALAYGD